MLAAEYVTSFVASPASKPCSTKGVRGSRQSGHVRTSWLSPWRSTSVRYVSTAFTSAASSQLRRSSRHRATRPLRSKHRQQHGQRMRSGLPLSLCGLFLQYHENIIAVSRRAAMQQHRRPCALVFPSQRDELDKGSGQALPFCTSNVPL